MVKREFKLDAQTVVLPRGTRICLRVDLTGSDGYVHKTASVGTVRESTKNTYVIETPSGRFVSAQRDQITIQRQELLSDLGARQWSFRALKDTVIYEVLVGSHAWGLANEASDEDVRGCFLAPFEAVSGLWEVPDEIHDAASDVAYWEIEKLIHQGLRGDANTLETLWSPLVRRTTPLGDILRDRRRLFVSMNILGSFGRYAQSQFKKIERSVERGRALEALVEEVERGRVSTVADAVAILEARGLGSTAESTREVHAVCRSLFDRGVMRSAHFESLLAAVGEGRADQIRPKAHRPKNAYNLLRLLHSCLSWLRTGEPLIQVRGDLRVRLLAVKNQQLPIEDVILEARRLAVEVEAAAHDSTLPERPDFEAADEMLRLFRRHAARASFVLPAPQPEPMASGDLAAERITPAFVQEPLPPDVRVDKLEAFLRMFVEGDDRPTLPLLWAGVTGSHIYGFPSPDSDLDIKAIHTRPAREILGLTPRSEAVDFLDLWFGREYDFTSHELGQAIRLLIRGNGNMLERLLGPLPVLTTDLGRELVTLSRASLNREAARHYGGFFRGMRREYQLEAEKGKRRAKRLLYAYRVALTGRHLLDAGILVTDVNELAHTYSFARVFELIEVKQGGESAVVEPALAEACLQDFDRLETGLSAATARSPLPPTCPNIPALSDYLVRARQAADCL